MDLVPILTHLLNFPSRNASMPESCSLLYQFIPLWIPRLFVPNVLVWVSRLLCVYIPYPLWNSLAIWYNHTVMVKYSFLIILYKYSHLLSLQRFSLSFHIKLGCRHYRQAALTVSRVNRFPNTRFTAILLNPFCFIPLHTTCDISELFPVVPSCFSVFIFYSPVFLF